MVKFVRVCPYCRSSQLQPAGIAMAGSEPNYECLRCGKMFPPFFAIEVDESLAK